MLTAEVRRSPRPGGAKQERGEPSLRALGGLPAGLPPGATSAAQPAVTHLQRLDDEAHDDEHELYAFAAEVGPIATLTVHGPTPFQTAGPGGIAGPSADLGRHRPDRNHRLKKGRATNCTLFWERYK